MALADWQNRDSPESLSGSRALLGFNKNLSGWFEKVSSEVSVVVTSGCRDCSWSSAILRSDCPESLSKHPLEGPPGIVAQSRLGEEGAPFWVQGASTAVLSALFTNYY